MVKKIVLYGCLGLFALTMGCAACILLVTPTPQRPAPAATTNRPMTPEEEAENNRSAEETAATIRRRAAAAAMTPAPTAARDAIVGIDPDSPALVKKARSFVTDLERHHVLARWSCVGNEAYIREIGWDQFDIDGKRGIARSLAVCCHAQKSGRYMTIKGFMSGRTLATFRNDDIEVAP